jgi:molybdenum cofactor biosynthesis enzyme MoaA
MYCPTELHDSTSQPHDLATMQQAWRNIYNKTQHKNLPYKISFTGGEVTANKNFLSLVEWLRTTYPDIAMILLTTNGSASQRYYEKLANVVNSISFSTHSEYMDEQRFFDTVLAVDHVMVRPAKSVHVNIMNEHWNQDRIELYKKWLDQHSISYTVNQIDYTQATRTYVLNQGVKNLAV